MTTLPNMSIVLPTRGPSGAGVWDDAIDADLSLVDAHDHSPGKGTLVPTSGIGINADLSFSSLYAPTNLHRVQFASVTALASGANNQSIFVSSADNELYWRSHAGNNVKMTVGSALNVSAFSGGIAGDYVSVAATEAFDDANKRYTFKDGAGNWARLASGESRIYPTGGTGAFYVGQAAPGGIAASYTMTWPAALPASTSLVQVDNTGAITASNATIGGTPNFTGAVTMASTFQVTGALTALSTLGATGLITATAGMTAAANQSVTLSGTGKYKHGIKTRMIGFSRIAKEGAVGGQFLNTGFQTGATSLAYIASLEFDVGERILAIRANIKDNPTGTTTVFFAFETLSSAGVLATVGNSNTSAGNGNNQAIALTSLTTTIAVLTAYQVEFSCSTTNTCLLYSIEVDYDQP